MQNDIILTQDQLQQLKDFKARGGPNANGDYSDMYSAIAQMLPPDSVERKWVEGAAQANRVPGMFETASMFSAMIRSYSRRQMALRGLPSSDELIQAASNKVASSLLDDILESEKDGYVVFPDIVSIARNDATAVGTTLFSSLAHDSALDNNSAWSGAILFSSLGNDQTWRLFAAGDERDLIEADPKSARVNPPAFNARRK